MEKLLKDRSPVEHNLSRFRSTTRGFHRGLAIGAVCLSCVGVAVVERLGTPFKPHRIDSRSNVT